MAGSIQQRLSAAEALLGHHFSNPELLRSALTHPSAVEGKPINASYERLEFLGDSILGSIIATDLYRRYPTMDEGEMTRLKISLVSGKTLSQVAADLGIAQLIVMGESERGTQARGMLSALENVYEALIGALYLDAGFDVVHAFVLKTLEAHIESATLEPLKNPKSELQEAVQRDFKTAPEYTTVSQSGPAHKPLFTVVVRVDNRVCGRGTGCSKKIAETKAAEQALVYLGYSEEVSHGEGA